MERVAGEVDVSHLEIGNLDAFGIFLFVQLGAHLEAGICCRRGDQLDDRAIAMVVMKEKRRCSILFHLLVPGGRWQTVIGSLSSSASF